MGRRIPDDNAPLSLILQIHPLVYLCLVGAGVAASIAIITSLCSVLFWKKPSASLSDTSSQEESKKESDAESTTITSPPNPQLDETTTSAETTKELPLPPAMLQPKEPHIPINMKRAASERGMSFNLSIKLPRTLSVARHHQKEEMSKKKKGGKSEEVWMKTIILGEKCQVPEDDQNAVIYEGKGKKVSAYHPKTRSTMSSSQFSFVDPDDDNNNNSNNNSLQPPPPPPPPPHNPNQ